MTEQQDDDARPGTMRPGDQVPEDAPGAGENLCPACGGSGQVEGTDCETCGGTGTVTEGVSGA
jgi:hypothetical protein